MQNIIDQWSDSIRAAAARKELLCIRGSGSKDFYGGPLAGRVMDVTPYRGIVEYDPRELVLTARAGTPLSEIEAALAQNSQMLPFEPPYFGPGATLGGCVASGLSGPRRASQGAVRDFVLGVRMLDGRGDDLAFGGKVIKNVAGYDVSRLMTGSMGTLGVLLEVSLKILPRPAQEVTLRFEMNEVQAIASVNKWAGQPLPLSATCHYESELMVRVSGAASAVNAARLKLGGEVVEQGADFWHQLREQTSGFFQAELALWRISLPSVAQPLNLPGTQLTEWGGAVRWLHTDASAEAVRDTASRVGGQATLFRGGNKAQGVFHPLPKPLMALQKRLKLCFDPQQIFNAGRIHDLA